MVYSIQKGPKARMIYFNILYFVNTLLTGILLTIPALYLILHSRMLRSRLIAAYWLLLALFLIIFNLEYMEIIKTNNYISDYILFFVPLAAFYYFNFVSKERINPYLLIMLIVPLISAFLKNRIMLFSIFYDLTVWMLFIGYSIVAYRRKKGAGFKNKRKHKFLMLWIILNSVAFLPYVLINLTLSIIYNHPIQIMFILPFFITISAVVSLVYYIRITKYYNDLIIMKSDLYDKRTIIEKLADSLIHEIKNPIAAIQSLNQQLQKRYKTMKDETVEKYFSIIAEDLERVRSLSDSFLSSCKKDSKLPDAPLDSYLLIQSIYELLKFDLQKREIKFELDKGLLNQKILFPSYKFRQIFINLLYNSMEAGAKNISIYGKKERERLEIFVEDNGEGIKLKHLNNLFTPYYTTKSEGTGLGLAICKKILLEHSGDINLQSHNKGKTIFRLTFRLNSAEQPKTE